MDLSNLSERDRKTVEKLHQKKADWGIVAGLDRQGYSTITIASMMGAPEPYVRSILRRLARIKKNS